LIYRTEGWFRPVVLNMEEIRCGRRGRRCEQDHDRVRRIHPSRTATGDDTAARRWAFPDDVRVQLFAVRDSETYKPGADGWSVRPPAGSALAWL
jgi:hypothetical protein